MRETMRRRREGMGASQERIAALIGITTSAYSRIERGVNNPAMKTLLDLEAVFGAPAKELMENTPTEIVPAGQ